MKLDDFLIGSGWTITKVAHKLDLPEAEVFCWEEVPEEYLSIFQEWLFDLDGDKDGRMEVSSNKRTLTSDG